MIPFYEKMADTVNAVQPEGEELVAVHGIGPTLIKKYASKLLAIVAGQS